MGQVFWCDFYLYAVCVFWDKPNDPKIIDICVWAVVAFSEKGLKLWHFYIT